jgi:hypothetical protein
MEFSIGVKPFTFHSRILKWENVTVEEMQVDGQCTKAYNLIE